MATLTTVICLYIIPAVALINNAAADPNININPTDIHLGISSALDINCTFFINNYPDMVALVSLSLWRANASGQNFQELAVITQFSPNSVHLLTQEKVTATGVHSQTGESFLHVLWDFPTSTQEGVYQCAAHGLDMLGHNVELTNISTVTVVEANLNDVFETLKQMQTHEKVMENTISSLKSSLESNTSFMDDKISSLENTISLQEDHIQSLNNTVAQLKTWRQNILAVHLEILGIYQDKEYYASNAYYQDINESATMCKSFGGTLIEIDDANEYNVIVGFLKNVISDIKYVMIGGTDEQSEGNWILPSTNQSLPFTAWHTGDPGVRTSENCLAMSDSYSWKMFDYYCHVNSPSFSWRFTCEISSVE